MDKPLEIDGLDGYQFEELIAKIMKKRGYEIKVVQKSRDVGKDIIMENHNGEIVLVECKHQKSVGRPIIQKLQGAMSHEEKKQPNRKVRGILVTSGNFSNEATDYNKEINQEIELINGKKLKNMCEEEKIIILNGKIQIISNKSFKNISDKDSIDLSKRAYSKIYGNKEHNPIIHTDLDFIPACYLNYGVNFNTSTSVGCIDNYSKTGEMMVNGVNCKEFERGISNFFFSGDMIEEEIKEQDSHKKVHFEFTENDVEEYAINQIINHHAHKVHYFGRNNVSYSKECIPKGRDINTKKFISIYLPFWKNKIKIKDIDYEQEFYVKGDKEHYTKNELKRCKICGKDEEKYEEMSICLECGRIVCSSHIKIDYLDKKTPICEIHAKPLKLWIQKKYFAKKENLKEYKEWWKSQGFFKKLYEDKIAFGLSLGGIGLILIILFSILL